MARVTQLASDRAQLLCPSPALSCSSRADCLICPTVILTKEQGRGYAPPHFIETRTFIIVPHTYIQRTVTRHFTYTSLFNSHSICRVLSPFSGRGSPRSQGWIKAQQQDYERRGTKPGLPIASAVLFLLCFAFFLFRERRDLRVSSSPIPLSHK